MPDYDPDEVEIRPAATVMLIADRPDLQVFMMERNANIVFAGGMWVFPGGRVDATTRLSPHVRRAGRKCCACSL